jgi:ABC-2 type transport system permease protein
VSPTRTVGLLAAREVRQRLRSRLFVWSTVVLSALLTLSALVPTLLGRVDRAEAPVVDREPVAIAVVGALDPRAEEALAAALGPLDLRTVADPSAAAAAVEEGTVDLAVVAGDRVLARPTTGLVAIGAGPADAAAEALALAALLAAVEAPDVAADVLALEPLPVELVGGTDPALRLAQVVTANVGVVFLFAMLMFYASMIVNGIIEEKGSRVVELLVQTVPVRQLMAGKVLGLGTVAVGQMLVLFAPATTLLVLANRDALPSGTGRLALLVVFWFLLGYAFYTLVSAGLGSLVSRPEEAQAVLTPATVLALLGYLAGFAAIQAPDSAAAVAAGWFPPSAPFVMLVRQALGTPTALEVGGSAVLLLAAILAAALLAARVYEGGILRVGARVRVRDAWRDAGR